jgi:DNA-binding CsgD family transcriptional regulator
MASGASLIGRDGETAQIERFLDALSEGSRTLLVEGEIGVGKTVLMQRAGEMVRARGYTLLVATPVEVELPLEFAALADLLEAVPRALVDALPGPQRQAVDVAVLRRELSLRPVDPRTIATAVLTVVRQMAAERPVVLLVDDTPWLDAASARVVSFVMRRAGSAPAGLIAAARTEWLADRPRTAVDVLDPDRVEVVRLGAMSVGALRELLQARLGLDVSRARMLQLHRTSGGNPLFAMHLAAQAPRGPSPDAPTSTPDELYGLVSERLAALSASERDVLLLSALCSGPTHELMRAAAVAPERADDDLDAVVRLRILTEHNGGLDFSHPLLRSVIAGAATPRQRRAAHSRLAAVVDRPEARLRHLALAATGRDETAASAAEEAATVAAARGANETAADLAELAVTLTPSDRPDDRHRRVSLEAECRFAALDPAQACSLLEDVLEALEPGPRRAKTLRNLARYQAYGGRPLEEWEVMLTSALDQAGDDDSLRAGILHDLGFVAGNTGDAARAMAYSAAALECAVRAGDRLTEAQLCAADAFSRFYRGEGVREDLVARALAAPAPPATVSMELRPRYVIALMRSLSDDLDGARSLFEQECTTAKEYGIETTLPILLHGFARNEAYSGNWARAESLTTEGYELAEEAGSPAGIAFMLTARALVHAYRGRVEEARADTEHAMELAVAQGVATVIPFAFYAVGPALLSIGDAAGTHELLGPSASVCAAGIGEPALVRFVTDDIEALIRLGELGAAEKSLAPYESRAVELGRGSAIAATGRCRGLLFAARGELGLAESALDAALEVHRGLPMPFEEARTLLVAGEVHRRARHRSHAQGRLQAALQIFEHLGAPRWAERARDQLGHLGIRRARAGPGLTAGEQQVADLAAIGLSNSQIAARLFMAQRTVEAHLSRVYRKLGVATRTEMVRVHLKSERPGT